MLAFDNDEAGQHAHDRLGELLDGRGVRWNALRIPEQHKDLNAWHAACRDNWRAVMGACDRLSRSRSIDRCRSVNIV